MLFSHLYTNKNHSYKPVINSVHKPEYCSKTQESLPVLLPLTRDNSKKDRQTFFLW